MGELFHKEVNAQKEKTSGVHASSHKPTKKCAMKMKQRNKKNDARVKMLLMEGSTLYGAYEKHRVETIRTSFRTTILDTIKELSLEFCFGKICSGGTKFSLKILVPGTNFSENFVPSLKNCSTTNLLNRAFQK